MSERTVGNRVLRLHIYCSCWRLLLLASRGRPWFTFWPIGVASTCGYGHVHDILFLNLVQFRLCCNKRSLFLLPLITLCYQFGNWILRHGSDRWRIFAVARSFTPVSFRLRTCGWAAFRRGVGRGLFPLFFIFLSLLFFLLGSFMFFRFCITRVWDVKRTFTKTHLKGLTDTVRIVLTCNAILFALFFESSVVCSSCSCC